MKCKNKILFSLFLLIIFFSLFEVDLIKVEAQTDLKIEGNVLGYGNESQLLPRTFGCCFIYPTDSILVKISSFKKGRIKSELIIVKVPALNKNDIEKFRIDKTITFSLERFFPCDKTIQDLMYKRNNDESGNIVVTPQKFIFVSGIEKKSLPIRKVLPCYFSREYE